MHLFAKCDFAKSVLCSLSLNVDVSNGFSFAKWFSTNMEKLHDVKKTTCLFILVGIYGMLETKLVKACLRLTKRRGVRQGHPGSIKAA